MQKLRWNRACVPREAVKIISGFSEEVAMAVIHPLWPSSDPRKRSDSDMVFSGFLAVSECDSAALKL
jgi:hypothetical protein